MKVKNHHDGNYTFVYPSDSTVIYGTIEMSQIEYDQCIKYLKRVRTNTKNTYIRDSLHHVFTYTLPQHRKRVQEKRYPYIFDSRISLGVCATELIFKKFELPRYKRQNYMIVIK